MRPARFQTVLESAARSLPGVSGVRAFTDADMAPLYGLVCTVAKREVWVQAVFKTAPGDVLSAPEAPAATGAQAVAFYDEGTVDSRVKLERALAAALVELDETGEMSRVRAYSAMDPVPATGHGLCIDYHDASSVYLGITEGRPEWW